MIIPVLISVLSHFAFSKDSCSDLGLRIAVAVPRATLHCDSLTKKGKAYQEGLSNTTSRSKDLSQPFLKSFSQKSLEHSKLLEKFQSRISLLGKLEQELFYKNLSQLPDKAVETVFFKGLSDCKQDCADLIASIDEEVAEKAFSENLFHVFSETARQYQVPIVLREPTAASQGLQQDGLSTKGMDIKNKSSLLPGIQGLIPINSWAGKIGDKMKKLLRGKCEKDEQSCQTDRSYIRSLLKKETELMNALLKGESHDQQRKYQRVPILRQRNHKWEVLVFKNGQAESTQWVPYRKGKLPTQAVWVLGDEQGNLITADTDLAMVGQPKGAKHEVKFDPQLGFRTPFTERVMLSLNELWKKVTGNQNRIIQHGDEANFGLNPLDDVLIAFDGEGRVSRFDLQKDNPNRQQELDKYAKWLLVQTEKSDILVPSQELQKKRQDFLNRTMGIFLDIHSPSEDYARIREVMQDKAIEPQSEVSQNK